jgi:hypothetical protein
MAVSVSYFPMPRDGLNVEAILLADTEIIETPGGGILTAAHHQDTRCDT